MSSPTPERYVPAAGRAWLTALYDPAMALTMREQAFRRALVAAVMVDPSPGLVLDIGCGTGTLAIQLAKVNPSIQVIGIDGDEAVLARARSKALGLEKQVRFQRSLAHCLPLEDASADVVIASLLLHHLPDKSKRHVLEEAGRVLVPGGRLVIADWGRPHDPFMRAAFFGLQLVDGFKNTRTHAAGRLPSLISDSGFTAVTVIQRWRTVWGSLELITAEY